MDWDTPNDLMPQLCVHKQDYFLRLIARGFTDETSDQPTGSHSVSNQSLCCIWKPLIQPRPGLTQYILYRQPQSAQSMLSGVSISLLLELYARSALLWSELPTYPVIQSGLWPTGSNQGTLNVITLQLSVLGENLSVANMQFIKFTSLFPFTQS